MVIAVLMQFGFSSSSCFGWQKYGVSPSFNRGAKAAKPAVRSSPGVKRYSSGNKSSFSKRPVPYSRNGTKSTGKSFKSASKPFVPYRYRSPAKFPTTRSFGLNGGFGVGVTPIITGTSLNVAIGSQQPIGGSSIAAQVWREHQYQKALSQLNVQPRQGVAPQLGDELDLKARELELLRLQIEIEKARLELERTRIQLGQPAVDADAGLVPPAVPQQVAPEAPAVGTLQLDAAVVIECLDVATNTQLQAERAFRSGDYGNAARFAGLAVSLDVDNGLLKLFASQALFANGEYEDSVRILDGGIRQLDLHEFGWVVENFRLFYGKNDYTNQTRALSKFVQQNPNDSNGWLLRGYQYAALGYPDAAKKDFDRAQELGADRSLLDRLRRRFVETETLVEN